VSADPDAVPLGVRHDEPLAPLTTMGWEQDPSGLEEILVRIRVDYGDIPLYITENGAAFEDGEEVDGRVEDPARVEYLRGHVAAVRRAIAAGVDVRRYFVWSLLDNFEWERGYAQRFGIVHVDFGTQRRVPKRSALWYRDHIAAVRA
jgi:beta-glucosidase